jgi:hypothetical protein
MITGTKYLVSPDSKVTNMHGRHFNDIRVFPVKPVFPSLL